MFCLAFEDVQSRESVIEVLSPKKNGTVESDHETKKAQAASIKSMWKKAFKSLKMSGGGEKDEQTDKPPDKDKEKKFTRLSSRRSLLRRKDSKDSNDAGEQQADDNEEIDPVYSLLKCAADLPKQSSRHPCTYLNRQSPQGSDSLTIRSSRSSSPSSETTSCTSPTDVSSNCSHAACPCHTPEVLENYHTPIFLFPHLHINPSAKVEPSNRPKS